MARGGRAAGAATRWLGAAGDHWGHESRCAVTGPVADRPAERPSGRGTSLRHSSGNGRASTSWVSLLVMDLRSLRYFVAVAEERHFGRAAARLHMTQPPLSRAIKQLETDVGALLVHRSPGGVTLTPAGTTLYDEARPCSSTPSTPAPGSPPPPGRPRSPSGLSPTAPRSGAGLADAFRLRQALGDDVTGHFPARTRRLATDPTIRLVHVLGRAHYHGVSPGFLCDPGGSASGSSHTERKSPAILAGGDEEGALRGLGPIPGPR